MRFSATAGLVTLAASTVASTIDSSPSDLDGDVWASLSSVKGRSVKEPRRNRPFKRAAGWSPPSDLTTPLKEVWDHCTETYNSGDMFGFKNYGWDQLIANEGTVNMCVRWESTSSITAAQRTKVATVVNEQYQKWFKWLYGYDNFPYTDIKVNVVGWAVKDKALLEGDTTGLNIYTDVDSEGIPQCAEACGRYFHQDGDYSGCAAGADNHYDQSLWLTDGISGGTGGDWGQRIGQEYFMEAIDSSDVHILLHEMGHTFGLDDFYDWTPTGITNFIMLAGSSTTITDFDGWMLRNWWNEISRERGWNTGTSSATTAAEAVAAASSTTKAAAATSTKATSTKATTTKATTTKATTTKATSTKTTSTKATSTKATTTKATSTKTKTTAAAAATTAASGSGSSAATASKWQQCGGSNWTGATACASGLTCTAHNAYYSQCL